MNVNTAEYWNRRFGSGDWERKGGFSQTYQFAEAQVPRFQLQPTFRGAVCDFGCGAGDAMPVYARNFPNARLVGVDFSRDAIEICRQRYGSIATFIVGDASAVPRVDVIVCSNVLEHLDDDKGVISTLLERCTRLYVTVPYDERVLVSEHVRRYDKSSFDDFRPTRVEIFASRGWSEFGVRRWIAVYALNAVRPFLGRSIRHRKMQIMYEFQGRHSA